MLRPLFTILIVFALITFPACKKVKPVQPPETTSDTLIQPPLSVVYVPVQYRVSAFEKLINEKVQGTFVDKWINLGDKGDSLHISVSRIRPITLKRDNRTLLFVVPLKISGIVRAKVAGIKIRNEAPVLAEINVHLATTLNLDSMWNMVVGTKLQKIDWIKEPSLKVAFIKVNLRGAIENILEKNEDQITGKADIAIRNALNTRKVVSDIWRDIQKPIRINKKGLDVWLVPYGIDLNGRLQETEPDLISLLFELQTYTRIYFQGDSIPPANTVIPTFTRISETSDSLNLYVHSLLRFDMVNDFLNKELLDKPIAAKGFSTTIKHVRVFGMPDNALGIELKVKGDIDGTLYVRGTPSYDSATSTITMHNFDFDINSESTLLNSADWLLHSTALDLISEKLKVSLAPLTAKLPDIIFNAIEKGKTGEKIDLEVSNLVLHPKAIVTTKNNLQLLVHATGRVKVTLNEKLFNKNDKKVSVK
jgi:hypothetical protein